MEDILMLHQIKKPHSIAKRTPLLCGLLCAAVIGLLPIWAGAQCSQQWDASGVWEIRQDRGGAVVRVDLTQSGGALRGTASRQVGGGRDGAASKTQTGTAIGDADGSTFTLQVEWPESGDLRYSTYRGKILASGRAEGGVYFGSNSTPRLSWYSEQPLTCGWRPGKSRGNLTSRLSANDPIKTSTVTPSPAATPPFISASQPIVPTPYHPLGIVVLSWDAGTDHPNVEVFLSIDNSAEIPAFSTEHAAQSPAWKQPKLSLQVNLQRYRQYRFFLKSGGKTLATTAAFYVQ